jgi:hypothetical protein
MGVIVRARFNRRGRGFFRAEWGIVGGIPAVGRASGLLQSFA